MSEQTVERGMSPREMQAEIKRQAIAIQDLQARINKLEQIIKNANPRGRTD